jgi:hypothetical protein
MPEQGRARSLRLDRRSRPRPVDASRSAARGERLGGGRAARAGSGPAPAWWPLPAAVAAAVAITAATAWWRWGRTDGSFADPLAGARYTRVTDWEGAEVGGSISADGKFVAFLSDRDGQYDVWVQQLGSASS